MNRYLLVKSGIDFNQGLRRFSNNKEMYEGCLQKFLQDPNFDGLAAALEQKDADAAFRFAHSLKGVAGNLSLQKLYLAVTPLVEELRVGHLEQAAALFEPVRENYAQVISALQ